MLWTYALTGLVVRAKAIEIARLQGVKEKSANGNASAQDLAAMRSIPPFIPAHDITRGAVFGFEALLRYALMLAVMCVEALEYMCHHDHT